MAMGSGKDKITLMSANLETQSKEKWRKKLKDDEYHRLMVRMPVYTGPSIIFTILIATGIGFYYPAAGIAIAGLVGTLLYLDFRRATKKQQKQDVISRSYLAEFGMENKIKCSTCGSIQNRTAGFCTSCGADF
ncbi:MAG: hypothetical protein INQ03_21160 [Candidatus Heimdallarchaeota archaeon]|nr:hypothetical protein [Candidatus Heimdallarchaeota archaeon]